LGQGTGVHSVHVPALVPPCFLVEHAAALGGMLRAGAAAPGGQGRGSAAWGRCHTAAVPSLQSSTDVQIPSRRMRKTLAAAGAAACCTGSCLLAEVNANLTGPVDSENVKITLHMHTNCPAGHPKPPPGFPHRSSPAHRRQTPPMKLLLCLALLLALTGG